MKTLRVTNVPLSVDQAALQQLFEGAGARPDSLSLAVDGESTQTATISLSYDNALKRAQKLNRTPLGATEQLRIEIDDRFDGITVLFNGAATGDGQKIDIVALHGLNGHAFKTFRSKEAGVMWLRDFLPKDFPHSRIMTYGYNANVFTNTSTAKIADFRQALLTSLERMRRTEEEKARPILFIAHSLGGIVLKAALTITIRGLEPILPRTCGIVFLGTPHCGSDSAKLAVVLIDIGTMAKRSTMMSSFRGDLVKSLKSNSPEFADISERFAQALFPKGFSILSCYEMKETRPPGKLIVSKNSAIIGFPGGIELTLPFLNSDHHEICKFENPAKPEYGDIVRFLKKALQSFTEGEGQSGGETS